MAWLIIDLTRILKLSDSVDEEQIHRWPNDDAAHPEWRSSQLMFFWANLAKALRKEPLNAQLKRAAKLKEYAVVKRAKGDSSIEEPSESEEIALDQAPLESLDSIVTMQSDTTSQSITTCPPKPDSHKRIASEGSDRSDNSFPSNSSDTTSSVFSQPEQVVRDMLSTFILGLNFEIKGWEAGPPVEWAEGRKMFLEYAPYVLRVKLILVPIAAHFNVYYLTI